MAKNKDYRPEDIAFPDQVIVESELVKEMKDSYIDYAVSVIVGRALPDVRDGLKPVHRRILYSMYESGLTSDKPFKKSATCVGDVLGKYHPHGDSSVYDALVRLAQDFSMRYRLIDGHGNFGSVDGDPPAAYRYTEARMAKMAGEMLADIEKETVDWDPNFDESRREPRVLPARFPNLLVNGSSGIAVGMATNIPPHNLREVIDAAVCVLDNPEADLADLMQYVKGPDFPTKGIIMGRSGIRAAYATGRGRVTIRARTEFEEYGRNHERTRIIVTELPYQVNPDNLADKIAQLVRDGQVTGIADIRDETSGRTGQRLVIVLKRDAVAKVVLNNLYKRTQLQDNFPANMLALVDGVPRTLSLDGFVRHWVAHQIDVIVRRSRFRLRKAEERLHILEGLLKAIDALDAVIALIRRSPTTEEARTGLMGLLDVDEAQAEAILSLQLRRLAALERLKIQEESEELRARVKDLREIIASPERQRGIVSDELAEIVEKYGDERRTRIVPFDGEMSMEDLIPEEDVVVTITRSGYAKRTRTDSYRSQHRGGKGIRGATLREDDVVDHFFVTTTHRWLLFFTNYGRVYRAKGYELPEGGRDSKGQHVANLLAFQPGEEIAQVMELQDYDQADYLVLATRRGLVKKTRLSEYNSNRSGGVIAINLRQDEEGNYDELVSARLLSSGQDLLLVSRAGQSLRFHADDDTLRPTGRATSGVTGMRFREDDYLLAMDVVDPSWQDADLFVVTEGGYAKRTNVVDYPVKGRGGLGVKVANLVEARGNLVGALVTDSGDEVLCIMASGKVVRSAVVEVSRTGRTTQGVTFAKPDAGDRIIAVARNTERDMEEAVDAADSAPSAESADSTDQAQALQAPEGDTGDSPADSAADTVALEDNESEVEA